MLKIKELFIRSLIAFIISILIGLICGVMWTQSEKLALYSILIIYLCAFLMGLFFSPYVGIIPLGLLLGQLVYLCAEDSMYNNAFWVIGIFFIVIITLLTIIPAEIGSYIYRKKKNG